MQRLFDLVVGADGDGLAVALPELAYRCLRRILDDLSEAAGSPALPGKQG